jgi:hypothetical protein
MVAVSISRLVGYHGADGVDADSSAATPGTAPV